MNQVLLFFFFWKITSPAFCIYLTKSNYGYNPQSISGGV
ncbi:hypothetical protein ECP03048162_4710 [Escherichia coli P0304816.2]|nr:hypothetical protein ECP03048162_4710 [Escherichia coli P0304816.2]